MTIPFTVPHSSAKYAGWKIATADLLLRKGTFWLHVVVDVPEPVVAPTDEVVGIDLGLNRPAVTSNHQFLGKRQRIEVDRRAFRLKRKLQSKGTRSAKRHLKKLSQKQMRFHRDSDHILSKRIIQNTSMGATIVFENLTNLRETSKVGKSKKNDIKRRLHTWSFAQLYDFTVYKAQERGMRVERIDPRHTSQTCSRCGHQARNNRRSQSLFLCRACGYCLNADYNASKNIREKHIASLASLGTSLAGGPPSIGLSSQLVADQGQAPAFMHGAVDTKHLHTKSLWQHLLSHTHHSKKVCRSDRTCLRPLHSTAFLSQLILRNGPTMMRFS
jgi:IS605 OrfB family transposase